MDSKVYDEEQQINDIVIIQQKNTELKWWKLILLEIAMLSPVLWVLLFLWLLKMPLACQLAFQLITLITIPIITLQMQQNHVLKLIHSNSICQELLLGFLFLISSLMATVVFGYIFFQYYEILDYNAINSLTGNKIQLILTLLLLSITNPFLEEFFWRMFLTNQYIRYEQFDYNESLKWYLSFHYAIYHFFVILFFTKIYIVSIIGFLIICIGGRIFFMTRDKFGLLTTSMFHMGVDMGIVILAIYKFNQ